MSTHKTIEQTKCYHCGDFCEDDSIMLVEKVFCCEGCRTVFQILEENNLCTYYRLDANAGNAVKTGLERKRFEYLLDIDVQHKLVDFKKGNTVSITFFIPNIHCTSCVWLLENLQNIDEGIFRGTVNFMKRTVTIIFDDSKTSLRAIVELLTTIGYEPSLKLEQLDGKTSSKIERSLWLKLGVAGFCFGNIMLFSFPEYLNMAESDSSIMFKYFFGALNIILALPVLLFSSVDYLKSAWAALSQKGINLDVPISIGILALFGRSLFEILSGTGAGYFDSFTGFIFFLLIGKVVQKKTFDRLSFDRDYKSYLPISVIRKKNGEERSIPVNSIEIGDCVVIRNQELIPADSINKSDSLLVDYSFITGESEPVAHNVGDQVFAGGKVIGANAEMIITKKVEHSYLTQLWENESFKAHTTEKKITAFADRISPYFTFTVLAIAVTALIVWLQIDATQAFTIFTAVLIIACPCALALSTPFTLSSTINILAINGFYLRSNTVVEELSKINTFVFDKTGTITNNSASEITFHGKSLSEYEKSLIKSTCRASTHPLSKAIFDGLVSSETISPTSFNEFTGKGISSIFNENEISIGSLPFLKEQHPEIEVDKQSIQYAGSTVHISIDGVYKGFFSVKNKVRAGLNEVLTQFEHKKFDLFLLSGDNEKEKSSLLTLFSGWKNMLFNQTPFQKLEFINQLKKSHKHVAMIGDGLNDAGALQASDFGIAVSDDMSSFSPACDAIIDANALQKLNLFVDFSRASFNIIIASFILSLMYNLTGLGFAITGHLSPLVAAILMPLSSVTIMAFTTVFTRIKAKQIGLKIWA